MDMKIKYVGIFLLIYAFSSCVPASKFNELSQRNAKCDQDRDVLKSENEKLTSENSEFKSSILLMKAENSRLTNDSSSLANERLKLSSQLDHLNKTYDELKESWRGNTNENKRLLSELTKAQKNLSDREENLKELQGKLDGEKLKLKTTSAELEKRKLRLTELEGILKRKDSVVNVLKTKVSDALLGFENNGLTVKVKNGKVYVSLEENLLFGSGSIKVDPKGVTALKKLSKVLEQNTDINVMIEGHTDDVPYRANAVIQDNWDLSVKRATSIVRILLEGSKIDPKRLTASGHGEYLPVNPAKTPEARQMNRRTEIILTPKLDELFKILETN
jgi:chemotaxis protein MotB